MMSNENNDTDLVYNSSINSPGHMPEQERELISLDIAGEEALLDLWERYEFLYNVSHEAYNKPSEKCRARAEIGAVMGMTENEVGRKMDSFRSQYNRLKRYKASSTGDGRLTGRQKWLERRMSFLEPHARKRRDRTNTYYSDADEGQNIQSQSYNQLQSDPETMAAESEDSTVLTQAWIPNWPMPPSPSSENNPTPIATTVSSFGKSKKRRRIREETQNEIESSLSIYPKEKDEIDSFFDSLNGRLRMIEDPFEQMIIRHEFEQSIYQGFVRQNQKAILSAQNTTQYRIPQSQPQMQQTNQTHPKERQLDATRQPQQQKQFSEQQDIKSEAADK